MLISVITLAIAGLLISTSAELAARGIVGPNAAVGIRIPSVTASMAAWQAGHRAARWWMHVAAVAFVATAVWVALTPEALSVAVGVGAIAGLVAVTVAGVVAHRAAVRVTADVSRDAASNPAAI